MEDRVQANNVINNKSTIVIYNILRELGFIPTLKGTKFLIKVIQIIINSENDFIVFEDIYKIIAMQYSTSKQTQIKNSIKYAIDNREEKKSINNFEKIFGYEYSPYYFTNKTIIEEIVRVIRLKYSEFM